MAKPKPNPNKNYEQEITRLKLEIEELEKANKELEAKTSKNTAPKNHFFRSLGVTFFVTLSIVTFMLFNVANWIKASVLDTEGFVEITQPLIEQPALQQTLQDEITNALFENIDVQSELEQALPENVKFLAGPLSSQVENFASQKVGEVLRSQQLNDVWSQTLESVHSSLVEYIENEENDGVVSIEEIYVYAGNQLGDSPVSFLLNKQLPDKIGTITIAEISWLDEARTYTGYIDRLPILFIITSVISFLLALVLAINKKKVLVATLALLLVLMISTTLALVIGREVTANQVQPQYSAAASEVYTVITNPLMARTQGYIALLSVVLLVFFVSSNIAYIKKARRFLSLKASKFINSITPGFDYPDWLNWFVLNRQTVGWTAFTVLFISFGVRIPPNYQQVLDGFTSAAIITLVFIIATVVLEAGRKNQK